MTDHSHQQDMWTAYTDGASRGNPGLAGCGAFIISPEGTEYKHHKFLNKLTNNQAEYQALILALTELVKLKATNIIIKADSELMIKQLKGEYRVKNPNIVPLFKEVQELIQKLSHIKFEHVRREYNKIADQLANLAIDTHLNHEL